MFTNKKQLFLYILGIVVLSSISFWRITQFFFFQDDFQFLWLAKFHPLHQFITFRHPGSPLETILLLPFFQLNPVSWQLFGILLKIVSSVLIGLFIFTLSKSKVAGIISGFLLSTSPVGLYSISALNYHITAIDSIMLMLSFLLFAKIVQEKSRGFYAFVLIFLFTIFLDPARILPFILLLPIIFLLNKNKKNYQVKPIHIKIFLSIVGVVIPVIIVWYFFATRGVSSYPVIFLQGMLHAPLQTIAKVKDVLNYFTTMGNIFTQPFLSLTPLASKYEVASDNIFITVLGFVVFCFAFFLLYQYQRSEKKLAGIFAFLLLWAYIGYLPNFLQEPRAPMSAINHYLFVSSIGYIGSISYAISFIKKRGVLVTIVVIYIILNIATANYFINLQLPYRNITTIQKIWKTISQNVSKPQDHIVFLFTGDIDWAGYSFMSFGSYQYLLLKNDPTVSHLPYLTSNFYDAKNQLCLAKVDTFRLYSWNITGPGVAINNSSQQRKRFLDLYAKEHCTHL